VTARLRVIDGRSRDYVRLPRYQVAEAAIEVQALADELDQKLATAYALVWSGKRIKALLLISDIQLSVASVRRTFADLAGLTEAAPTDPDDAVAVLARSA
jgi:hypothetical protein